MSRRTLSVWIVNAGPSGGMWSAQLWHGRCDVCARVCVCVCACGCDEDVSRMLFDVYFWHAEQRTIQLSCRILSGLLHGRYMVCHFSPSSLLHELDIFLHCSPSGLFLNRYIVLHFSFSGLLHERLRRRAYFTVEFSGFDQAFWAPFWKIVQVFWRPNPDWKSFSLFETNAVSFLWNELWK